jgi:luciferase family oxidoreductase group 1
MGPDGARLRLVSGDIYDVRATPAAAGVPTVWLLGSSDYSARLAAELGLPYVFANHFSGQGMDQILALYRDGYRPSEEHPEPRTFITVNVVVAPTADEAHERALPQLRLMAKLRSGQKLGALETVEEAVRAMSDEPADGRIAQSVEEMRTRWLVGDAARVAAEVRDLAERYGVEEVMLVPVAGSREDEPLDATPGRAQTLELLTAALLG